MMAKAKVHRLEFLHRDRGYRFQDRDPQMVELCHIIDQSSMTVPTICGEVSKATGGAYRISTTTVYNWLNGTTRRPQNLTMNWVGYALGYTRAWTKIK